MTNSTSCQIFYNNFQLLYIKNYYLIDHIWNSGEIGIQVGKQVEEMLAKCDSQLVYNTVPKSKEGVTMNCAINALRGFLPTFYICRGENCEKITSRTTN